MKQRRSKMRWALTLAVLCARIACAGPPFLTDDPEPTDTGHWEIYAPTFEAAGRPPEFEGSAGAEFNYGAAPDVQLTVAIPVGYSHASGKVSSGRGDLELSVKYRLLDDEAHGLQIALFPGITAPSGAGDFGARHVTALLPVWFQKDADAWSLFGGGGFAINPGHGNRNYWTYGIALSHELSKSLVIGFEADRQGADTIQGSATTSLGVGAILRMSPTLRLLGSVGPTFEDGHGTTLFHLFVALGLDF
jgi:hypothetical protein